MTSAVIAVLLAGLTLAFVEALGYFYPARKTWWRLRRTHGRKAVRAMRERVEEVADRRTPRVLAEVLLGFMVVWIAISPLLDKRWYEVAVDAFPYVFVGIALFRSRPSLKAMAVRMRDFEREAGEDPDKPFFDDEGDGDASAIAL
jgi:hypothetical protein